MALTVSPPTCRLIYPVFSMIIATLNLRRIGLNGSVSKPGRRYTMIRDTMVYYRSFRESLRELPPDLYKVVSETIFDYAFEGIGAWSG